jgi:hypothetical protein
MGSTIGATAKQRNELLQSFLFFETAARSRDFSGCVVSLVRHSDGFAARLMSFSEQEATIERVRLATLSYTVSSIVRLLTNKK